MGEGPPRAGGGGSRRTPLAVGIFLTIICYISKSSLVCLGWFLLLPPGVSTVGGQPHTGIDILYNIGCLCIQAALHPTPTPTPRDPTVWPLRCQSTQSISRSGRIIHIFLHIATRQPQVQRLKWLNFPSKDATSMQIIPSAE